KKDGRIKIIEKYCAQCCEAINEIKKAKNSGAPVEKKSEAWASIDTALAASKTPAGINSYTPRNFPSQGRKVLSALRGQTPGVLPIRHIPPHTPTGHRPGQGS